MKKMWLMGRRFGEQKLKHRENVSLKDLDWDFNGPNNGAWRSRWEFDWMAAQADAKEDWMSDDWFKHGKKSQYNYYNEKKAAKREQRLAMPSKTSGNRYQKKKAIPEIQPVEQEQPMEVITPDEQPIVQSTEVSSDGDVPAVPDGDVLTIPDDFDSDEAKALRDWRTYFNSEEVLRLKKFKWNYKGKGDWWTSPELDQDLRKKKEKFVFHKRAWKQH